MCSVCNFICRRSISWPGAPACGGAGLFAPVATGMLRYLISLDLFRPHQNAAAVASQLRALDEDCENVLSNVWLISSNLPVQYIRMRLAQHLSANDRVFICDIGTEVAGVNLASQAEAAAPAHNGAEPPASFMASLRRSILGRRSRLLVNAVNPPVKAATAESSRSA